MAVLTVTSVGRAGTEPSDTMVAAAAGGDGFPNTGVEFVLIKNASVGSITVTFPLQQSIDGQAVTSRTVAVPAGEERLVGPFSMVIYNDANGRVQMTYSGVTTLTVGAFKLGAI